MSVVRGDPLLVERTDGPGGLGIVRQAAPPSAATFAATYLGPAGYAYDPRGFGGLAVLTNQLLASGAGRLSRIALARELDRRGATLSTRCHPESAEVTITGPLRGFPALLGILADIVQRPRFPAREIDRARRQLAERQLRDRSQPDRRAEKALFRAIFPSGHPYRETGTGDHRSIGRIDRREIVAFHRRRFTSRGGLVVVTHSAPLDVVARSIGRAFDALPEGRIDQAPRLPPSPTGRGGPIEISMPGRAQTEIRFGGPSIHRSSPFYAAAFLANEILGGRPLLNRLFQSVREARGLAYHASSELEAMRWGGYWTAEAGTGPERAGRVVRLVERELDRIRGSSPSASELQEIRESVIGELPLGIETTAGAHEMAMEVAYHDLPDDFLRRWPGLLRKVRPSEVRRAAEEALGPDGARCVIAGS